MGVFGTALFSDDLAADIRAEFKELIGDGKTPQEATDALAVTYAASLHDEDEATVFWLALAATQWKTGRLLPAVKDEAIRIIDTGADLNRWIAEGDIKQVEKRKAVLQQLQEQLHSPLPAAKRLAKVYKSSTPFEVGDVFSYAHSSGNFALLRVLGHAVDAGGCSPRCELLDFFAKDIPQANEVLEKLPFVILSTTLLPTPEHTTQLRIGDIARKHEPKEKVRLVAKGIQSQQRNIGPWCCYLWRNFDEKLTSIFLDTTVS
ncbi:hypothetical protein [Hymenobacter elongatus]|uniref:hypothetical protein n=1 Tax=Hymenobacter elongatus TaxID=877208 RepID=UPI001AEC250D|nr:hypothetical protein [Hymenobacter elongatus]